MKHNYHWHDTDWYKLTDYERTQILALVCKFLFCDEETLEATQMIESGHVKKVHNFISDTPGFVGDIYFIAWPGGPEMSCMVTRYAPDGIHETWSMHQVEEAPLK